MKDSVKSILTLAIAAMVVAFMIFTSQRMARQNGGIVGASIPAGNKALGKPAPDFSLRDLNGKVVKLSDYRGKAVLVNFWATYCGPCKVEMPWLVELKKQYGPQGFEILGVATDVDTAGKAGVDQFAKEMGVNYQIVLGAINVEDAYGGVDGLPMNFFVDRNGTIVANSLGLTDRREIEENIKRALGATSASVPAPLQPQLQASRHRSQNLVR